MDIDGELSHRRARESHADRQRILALRHAASVLGSNMPTGEIQRKTIRQIQDRLRSDARLLEQMLE